MRNLQLAVKREYFEQIIAGMKPYEYRLDNEYWRKRLVGRDYDTLTITLGYPKADDESRIFRQPYRGYKMATLTHKHFGNNPERVFALVIDEQSVQQKQEGA